MDIHKTVIIGSGPAGLTAALYAARAELNPIVIEGFMTGPGGQLMLTTDIENYPGFPEGIQGPQLMARMKEQVLKFGAKFLLEDVQSVDFSKDVFEIKAMGSELLAHTVIIATGAEAKRLGIPGTREGELWQKGVSACATCDGALPLFRDKELYVIGGGDTAMEEALFLTRYGKKVYIVHRRDQLRASKIMGERAKAHPKIEIIWDSVVEEALGENTLEKLRIKNVKTEEITEHAAQGLFFAVGHQPNTGFLKGHLDFLDNDYIKVIPGTPRTSVEGVFACGDVMDHVYRQAITAAGTGCMAALETERYLQAKGLG